MASAFRWGGFGKGGGGGPSVGSQVGSAFRTLRVGIGGGVGGSVTRGFRIQDFLFSDNPQKIVKFT